MSEWQQVNVRVRESNYEEWKEYAESEYGGLSDLVRTAVRREIDGQHAGASGGESAAKSETVTEVLEAIDRLENTVNGMDNRLSVVRETVDSSGPDFSLRAAVRETLRAADDGLTAGQIAARLDAKSSDVEDALWSMEGDEAYPTEDDPDTEDTRWSLFGGV
ncbi:MAG: hypothetical protein ACI80F_002859 [Natronomonas sp.]|jgi:hypothetical protein|uniref:hypothetical protein n=1 Tax=Natronomonas sp. TaxID=2184060 RepID=UPI00398A086E